MTERLAKMMAIKIGRRQFVQRSAAAVFGLATGLSIGQRVALADYCCTGP